MFMSDSTLYYGDPGAPGLRRHVTDDPGPPGLIYLDPPLGSNQDYLGAPGLFAERDGTRAAAHIKELQDTWRWCGTPAALVDAHYDIRTIQQLLGHKDVPATMIHSHGLNQGGRGVQSPADRLGPESFREPEP